MGPRTFQQPTPNQTQNRNNKKGHSRGRGIPNKEEPMISKVTWGERNKVVKAAVKEIESKYYNPDPLFWLIGAANESDLRIDGHLTTALIDSGAQIEKVC